MLPPIFKPKMMTKTRTIRVRADLIEKLKEQKTRYPFTPISKFIEEAIIEKLTQAPTLKPRTTKL